MENFINLYCNNLITEIFEGQMIQNVELFNNRLTMRTLWLMLDDYHI